MARDSAIRRDTTPVIRACLLAVPLGFFLSLPLTAVLRPLARRLGQMDLPGSRKRHDLPMPVAGGVAVFWAVAGPLVPALFAAHRLPASVASRLPGEMNVILEGLRREGSTVVALLVGAFVLHLAGLLDDRRGLSPLVKLGVQLAASGLLALGFGVRLLPAWFGVGASVAVTLLWFATVINAFNFLDGLDGLMAGVAVLCAAMFLVTALLTGQWIVALILALLIGALLGFLVFNLPPATIFMGDGGSLVVGYLLAFSSVRLTYYDFGWRLDTPWYAVFTPLVVLAIPLYDVLSVTLLRLGQGRSPLLGDDQHFPHRLTRRGLQPRSVLILIFSCTLATGIGGVMLVRLEAWQALLVALQTGLILIVLAMLEGRPSSHLGPQGAAEASLPREPPGGTEPRAP